ncbi:MAG: DUF2059 domain-containing protein [Epsilonproteobacteria bacterium]|nr:DUF2059 domain-containing protein [Campylobacterota bacterium]
MRQSMVVIFLVSLLSISLCAKAQPKLVEEYLEVSSAKKIILALPQQIERGYLKSVQDESLKQIDIKSSFDIDQAMTYVREVLQHEFNDEILEHIIIYYKSDLGKKFMQSGLNAMQQKDIVKRKKFYAKLQKNPPSYARVNVMNAFVDKLELTPVAVHLIGELLGSINAKLVTSKDTEKVMQNVASEIKEHMFEISLYAYNDFSDQELKQVMEYYYTTAGKTEQYVISELFKELIMESFMQIMEENQQRMADSQVR